LNKKPRVSVTEQEEKKENYQKTMLRDQEKVLRGKKSSPGLLQAQTRMTHLKNHEFKEEKLPEVDYDRKNFNQKDKD
jgi:hypothetical protein